VIGLAPHPEVTREPVAQHIAGARIGADGEADRGGRAHVGGAPHGPPERLLQHARHGRKFGAAAGHIERFDRPVRMRREQFLHHLRRTFHQRPAKLVIRRHGNRNLAPAFAHATPGPPQCGAYWDSATPCARGTPRAGGKTRHRRAIRVRRRGPRFPAPASQDFVEVVAAQIRRGRRWPPRCGCRLPFRPARRRRCRRRGHRPAATFAAGPCAGPARDGRTPRSPPRAR
jgi:hypothetical protein